MASFMMATWSAFSSSQIKQKKLNITEKIKEINMEQVRSAPSLKSIVVAENHTEFWGYLNVIYTANKTILLACPGGLEEITVYSGCKKIGPQGLSSKTLKRILFEDDPQLTELQGEALAGSSVAHIDLPAKTQTLSGYCFSSSLLQTIKFNDQLSSVMDFCFYQTKVTTIDFSNCSKIKCLYVSAFHNCDGLRSIILPPNTKEILERCFYNCISLELIVIPQFVERIEPMCFQGCANLESVVWKTDLLTVLSSSLFKNCGLKSIQIPKSVQSIDQNAFEGNPNLVNVTFLGPSSLSFIQSQAFRNSNSINRIKLPHTVSKLSPGALSGMLGLMNIEVDVPEGSDPFYTSVGGVLFDRTRKRLVAFPGGLREYEIDKVVEAIEERAFFECSRLEVLNFSDSALLSEIGSYTFSDCTSLSLIKIPPKVRDIQSYAFYGCSSLSIVTFSKGSEVGTLKTGTFDGCNKLKGVLFLDGAESNLTCIEDNVFSGCKELLSFDAINIVRFGSSSFFGCKSLKSVNLLKAAEIGTECFRDCVSLTSIKLGECLMKLEEDCFRGCRGLVSISYCGIKEFIGSSFDGVICSVSVKFGYPFPSFGGRIAAKALDDDCEFGTHRFTVDGGANMMTAFVGSVIGLSGDSDAGSS